jgi:hypothetical protein
MSAVDFNNISPTSRAELAAFPLLADTQFAEEMGSESFNRKFVGIVAAGIYRGFDVVVSGVNKITIGSAGKGTAAIERDGQLITVQGQHPIEVFITPGIECAVVIEAISQHGLLTNQVDKNSLVAAAQVKVVPIAELLSHHVVITKILLPNGTPLNAEHLDLESRTVAGLDNKPTFEQADDRYQLKGEYLTQTDKKELELLALLGSI